MADVSQHVTENLCILKYILSNKVSKRNISVILKAADRQLIKSILEIAQNSQIPAALKKRIRGKKNIIKFWPYLVSALHPIVAELHGN